MALQKRTIVLVLKSSKSFSYRDVELIVRHIHGRWESFDRPRIICLWDKASEHYDLGNMEMIPLTNDYPGTWARMQLYSPEMEQYRPFLYIDLDMAVIKSLEQIFSLIEDPTKFITLEDFWQPGQMATALVWFPAKSEKVAKVWQEWQKVKKDGFGFRMDNFLRRVVQPDLFWQRLTETIFDFKPRGYKVVTHVPATATLICFHGKPRIFDAAESSVSLDWVKDYINYQFAERLSYDNSVTVIIPYKRDRGWLKDAIKSVPKEVQLLVSQGEGNWPENFNKVLNQATGNYIRYLHEDDMLTENCIEDSVRAINEQNVDFIHGNAMEIFADSKRTKFYRPAVENPTLDDLLRKNYLHSATIMYRRRVFEELGGFDERLNTAEEYEFSLRLLRNGKRLGYCNSTLAYYRRHPLQKVRIVPAVEKIREREQVRSEYR